MYGKWYNTYMTCKSIITTSHSFLNARISPKENSGANGKFLPKPLLFHLRHSNSKTNEPKFWQILSPKNSFAKTSSALFRHLPEYLEGRTPKEKHPFLFQKKFHPRQIKNARSVFLSGLPRLCEAVVERYERTRQFRATTHSARAISRHQGCFQNTFELCIIHTASSVRVFSNGHRRNCGFLFSCYVVSSQLFERRAP